MAVAQASALQDALKTKMDELEAGLRGISDADAARKPSADDWSVKELLSHLSGENDDFLRWVRRQYDRMGELVAGMSEEQLSRKAHVPLFKQTPLGEYPTLAQWTQGIIDYHLADHVRSLPSMREKLGV